MAQSKVTFKSIPYFPDLVIKEAVCNPASTWEDFLKGFGVDLVKVAPDFRFIVRSRKGVCTLSETIDQIAAKYVQKYRILVNIEQELRTNKIKPRQQRRRRRKVVEGSEQNGCAEAGMPYLKSESRAQAKLKPAKTTLLEIGLTTKVNSGLDSGSPHLIAALKRSIARRRASTPKPNSVAFQLQMLRSIAPAEQARMTVEAEYGSGPSVLSDYGCNTPLNDCSSFAQMNGEYCNGQMDNMPPPNAYSCNNAPLSNYGCSTPIASEYSRNLMNGGYVCNPEPSCTPAPDNFCGWNGPTNSEYNCPPCNTPQLAYRFPPFTSIWRPSHINFETRIEKIDDYNVIRRSSIIWPNYGYPPIVDQPMRCFSMTDDDFNL